MTDAWTFAGPSSAYAAGDTTVTLVEGTSFCLSSSNGDIEPGTTQGLFFRDTRFLSMWRLTVNGACPETLAVEPADPFAATFVARGRPRPGHGDSTLLVLRRRFVGNGMREDLVLRNLGPEAAACTIAVEIGSDFAHLFEVKEDRVVPRGQTATQVTESSVRYAWTGPESSRGVEVSCSQAAAVSPGQISMQIVVPPRDDWRVCFQVRVSMEGQEIAPRYGCDDAVERSAPAARLRDWRRSTPFVTSSHEGLSEALARSEQDLGALRIFDPDYPDLPVVAAGSPWYMTLFGRDALITSYMTLMVDPALATGTLQTLARFQGVKEDPLTEEQPGRILHEMRWGLPGGDTVAVGQIYYGTADATPLFVMLLGELRRWGLADDVVEQLLPHADRALEWIENHGDRDGDGFVEYQRATDRGLQNQGWKDSWDGINFINGRVAETPIAVCEVQAYVYAAHIARAHFAREAGDAATERHHIRKASDLRAAFNEAFWLPHRGWYAVALDADKRPVDALTSNIGHCLWTGIVDEDKAAQVAEHLLSTDMCSGWGVRTLGSSMGAYNPMSYHNGSVWPHDTAIAAAGLMRYGCVAEAQRLAVALLEAAQAFGGRLPELFCGFDRAEFAAPVLYPSSCSPQAWAAAAPFSLLRTLLRFDPWVPHQKLWLAPAVPGELGDLLVENIPLAGSRLAIEVSGGDVKVSGLPPDLELVSEPRYSLHGPFESGA